MTPNEKNVVKSLVAVAWADGRLATGELGLIEGLLCGFDATDAEEQEILDYAGSPRSIAADIPLEQLSREDRELLLTNAALLTLADGERSSSERGVLDELVRLLEFSGTKAESLIAQAGDGTLRWSSSCLTEE